MSYTLGELRAHLVEAFAPDVCIIGNTTVRMIVGAIDSARSAARAYAARVNDLGAAADDSNPKVMETAGPIGITQAELWMALGIYDEELAAMGKVGQ